MVTVWLLHSCARVWFELVWHFCAEFLARIPRTHVLASSMHFSRCGFSRRDASSPHVYIDVAKGAVQHPCARMHRHAPTKAHNHAHILTSTCTHRCQFYGAGTSVLSATWQHALSLSITTSECHNLKYSLTHMFP